MSRILRPLAALALGVSCLVAQTGGAPAAPGLRSVAGVHQDREHLIGVAGRYRAEFGERAVTYRPALGRDAPRAHACTLSLVQARRGGEPERTAGTAPMRTHDRRAVRYRWPWATEQYEPRPQGLKHSIVFDRLPDGGDDADLVITLAVAAGALQPDANADAWLDEQGVGVTVGDVVAIDANGARCRGSKALAANGHLELSIPASFCTNARLPLTVDPLIGTATPAYAGTDNDFPDVAYEAASNTWCVVWTQFLGGGQSVVNGSVWLASPLTFGYAFGINQPASADSVRVTTIAGQAVFVLAWVTYEPGGNWVRALALEPVQGLGSAVLDVDGPYPITSPALSGEATVYDDDCLCVWRDDQLGVLGCSLQVDAQLQLTATPFVQLAAGSDVAEPAISKQGGEYGLHLVTWTDRPIGQPGWIRGQVVDHDMNLLGPAAWLQATPQDAGWSASDGDGARLLVAWEEQELQNPSSTDLRGKLVTIGPAGITSVGAAIDLAAAPGVVEFGADVARLGDMYGVTGAVVDQQTPFGDDAFVQILDALLRPIGAALRLDVTTGGGYLYEHAPRLIGRIAGDPNTNADDGLIVFADQNITTTFDSDVGLQQVEALGPGGPIVDLGGGCGPAGLASTPGPAAIGNPALALELFAAQPLAVPFVLLGLPNQRVPCGVCAFVDPLDARFAPNTAGTAATTLAIPGNPILIGAAFEFQFVTLNVSYVGCPALPGVAASNIVRVTIDV